MPIATGVFPKSYDVEKLSKLFLEDVYRIPGGEKIKTCIQCGTCSGSCPTSYAMDYTPREIIAAFRAGMLDRVLNSNTVWTCVSCYSCTVRCPMGIKITDIMYELKRLAIEFGYKPPGVSAPALSKSFVEYVDRYGRVPDGRLSSVFLMKTDMKGAIGMLPLALKLLRKGRLPLRTEKIRGVKDLRKMNSWLKVKLSAKGE
jgi:heterodisulfide reductase subunit C